MMKTILLSALVLSLAPIVMAQDIPDAKQVKTVSVRFEHPEHKAVEFNCSSKDWEKIRKHLLPAKHDPNPARWKGLGRIEIVKNDGQPFHISLYQTNDKSGAFSAGNTFEERKYFRGGNTSELLESLISAFENSTD